MPGPVFIPGDTVNLRTIEEEDLPFLQEAINDPTIWRGIGRRTPANEAQERDFYENVVCSDETITLLVTADGTPVGTAGFNDINQEHDLAELGYWIAPDHQDEGYGTAATERLVEYGFEDRGFHRISARVFEFNEPSQRLLESVGFEREGAFRDAHYVHGEYQDVYWYGILEDEWDTG